MSNTAPTTPVQHRCRRIVHSEASTGWGGQEHRVLAELRGFGQLGSKTWLIAPFDSGVAIRAAKEGIQVHPFSSAKLRFLPQVISLSRWFRRERIEVLNTHSSRDGWLCGLAGRLARVPLLIRSRHIDVDYPNPWLSRHAYTTFADHVLTTSDKISCHFQRTFNLPSDRITTIPTGIDISKFTPHGNALDWSPFLPRSFDGPRIGMISVLRSWKGHEVFLKALQQLVRKQFPFHAFIVGDGPIRERIEAQINSNNLTSNVHMLGHREDIDAVLRSLDALVIPSTAHEGIPQIGLQALSSGTPVVGSTTGGIPEIIRPGVTGRIFPSGDASALAASLCELFRNKVETTSMVATGIREARENHSLEVMLRKLGQLYDRYLEPAVL